MSVTIRKLTPLFSPQSDAIPRIGDVDRKIAARAQLIPPIFLILARIRMTRTSAGLFWRLDVEQHAGHVAAGLDRGHLAVPLCDPAVGDGELLPFDDVFADGRGAQAV